jgi:hypothetical protein
MNKVKVENYTHLFRDENSKAIVNTNISSYRKRLMKVKKNKEMKNEIDDLKLQIIKINHK